MDFETACVNCKAFTKQPPNEVYLDFYGLYKQVTVGDVNINRPGLLDLTGRAKYDAWLSRKGMSEAAAKAAYVALYEKYSPIYA
ncbi:acyl-CoA-binding protein [Scaptodrosophila lebanonensis]|uniref:Acyl-CoA-binding protein n=1 Tax=Drosophila lebanonensis TaxID=7225 RepID=A0A6J2TCT9_DROLE|nr:acyl-CoA-binding protein [Scaptodrosophila lebanonensis]